MSAIAHPIATQTADQNHGTGSTGYTDISGTTIASTEFVTGETYLILVMAQTQGTNAAGQCGFRVVHGSTAFEDSEESFETVSTGTGKRQWYFWWHIWTAVSGEGLKAQFDNMASADDVYADAVQILALRIHDFASGDRQFNERPDDDALSTTPLDGASVTFTADGSDVWLLLTAAWLDPGSTTTSVKSRANLDGSTYGEAINEGEDTSLDRFVMCTAVPRVPSSGSHTLKEQSTTTSGTAHTRLHSKVAAINLSAYFKDVSYAYTDTPLSATASAWADAVQTLSHTKTVDGDALVITSFIQKTAANSWTYRSRLQTGNADTPDGQTAPNSNTGYTGSIRVADGPADATGFTVFAIVNLTANATFDADGYVDTAVAGREYQSRGIVAFSMELLSAGVTVTPAHAEASATAVSPTVSAPFTFTAAHAEGSALAIAPAVSAPETVVPTWAEGSAVAVPPTPVFGSVTVVPAAAVARALAPDPTVVEGSVSVTPAWAEASALAVAPSVTTPLTVTPAWAESSALAVEPTLVLGSVTLTPAAAVARTVAVAPTTVEGSLTLTPEYAHTHTEVLAPTVTAPLTLTPDAAVARAQGVAPVVVEGSLTLTPAWAESSALAVEPTVVLGSLLLTPEYAHTHTEAIAPTIETGGVSVVPAWAEASAVAVEPVVVLGSLTLTPAAAVARAQAVAPTTILGSITVLPEYAHTHTAALAPAVVLGSLTLTPAWAEASATAPEPVVVLGSLLLTPTHAEASATAPDPTVSTGADVTLTPAFAAARALAVLLLVEQEGYRWRNDDGDEATATWQQAQDTPGVVIPGATVRLRMLVNGVSGDPVAEGYRLEYRKQGEQNWQVVS